MEAGARAPTLRRARSRPVRRRCSLRPRMVPLAATHRAAPRLRHGRPRARPARPPRRSLLTRAPPAPATPGAAPFDHHRSSACAPPPPSRSPPPLPINAIPHHHHAPLQLPSSANCAAHPWSTPLWTGAALPRLPTRLSNPAGPRLSNGDPPHFSPLDRHPVRRGGRRNLRDRQPHALPPERRRNDRRNPCARPNPSLATRKRRREGLVRAWVSFGWNWREAGHGAAMAMEGIREGLKSV